jgi:transcriptional regulator with XRE-family HTH domain
MTQKELADLLDCKSATTINKWESKISSPPISKVRKIAEIFQRDFSEICDIDIERHDTIMIGGHPTPDEMQQLLKFRALSARDKAIFRAALNKAYEMTERTP